MGLASPVIARALKACERDLLASEEHSDAKVRADYLLAAKNAAGVYLALIQADATYARAKVDR